MTALRDGYQFVVPERRVEIATYVATATFKKADEKMAKETKQHAPSNQNARKAPAKPEGAVSLTGGYTGASWMPQARDFNDDRKVQEIEDSGNPNSFIDGPLAGKLQIIMAWGRRVYAVEMDGISYKVPEHEGLRGPLNRARLGAHVYIECLKERGKATGKGQAPFKYEVLVAPDDVATGDEVDDKGDRKDKVVFPKRDQNDDVQA